MDGIQYHDVTWAAIAQLKYPVAKPLRKNWTADQIAEITPFEGEAVRTTGYLVAFKPQSGGNGEGTNCHLSAPSDTDTHMALVEDVGDAEKSSSRYRVHASLPEGAPQLEEIGVITLAQFGRPSSD